MPYDKFATATLGSQRLKKRFSAKEIDELIKTRAYRLKKVTMGSTSMNCCNGCPCIIYSTACVGGGGCGTDCCTCCGETPEPCPGNC